MTLGHGDWLSDDTGLGFRGAFLCIAAVLLLLVTAHFLTPVNGTLLFWPAFVLTRPLGAAGGDWPTKPVGDGGLGWGTVGGTAALLVLLAALTAYQARMVRRDPLLPLPAPVDRRTGRPQQPSGSPAAPVPSPA